MYEKPTCRLCLSDEGNLEEIFNSGNFQEKISECTNIQIKHIRGLPSCICDICKSELIIWATFKRQCSKTDEFLKNKYPELFIEATDPLGEMIKFNSITDSSEAYENDGKEKYFEYIEDEEFDNISQDEEDANNEEFQIDREEKVDVDYDDEIKDIEYIEEEEFDNISQDEEDIDNTPILQTNRKIKIIDVKFLKLLEDAINNDENETQSNDYTDTVEIIPVREEEDEEHFLSVPPDLEGEKVPRGRDLGRSLGEDDIRRIGEKAKSRCGEVWKINDGKRVKYHTKCKICGKMQQNIKQHMLIHSNELPFKCPYCQRGFRQRSNFKHHIYIHTGEKPYKCKICEKSYSDPASVRSHMIHHTGERPYHCDLCGKAFGHSHTLTAHKRIHTQDRQHSCEYCGNKFLSKHALKKHIRTHTGERPFQCDQCPKSFTTSGNLSTHKRVHTKERPYQCQVCGLNFSYKSVLKTHMNKHADTDEDIHVNDNNDVYEDYVDDDRGNDVPNEIIYNIQFNKD